MRIGLWKGYHSPQLATLIARYWDHDDLLVLCSPRQSSLDFVRFLPAGPIEFLGDWNLSQDLQQKIVAAPREAIGYPEKPVLGVFTSGTTEKPRLIFYSKSNIETSFKNVM